MKKMLNAPTLSVDKGSPSGANCHITGVSGGRALRTRLTIGMPSRAFVGICEKNRDLKISHGTKYRIARRWATPGNRVRSARLMSGMPSWAFVGIREKTEIKKTLTELNAEIKN